MIRREPSDEPDGVFVSWRLAAGTFTLVNDRYGLYPCFYTLDDDTLRVSPSILRLIAEGAPPTLDDEALAVFLRLGFFLDDRTPFRAIRAVPPGVRLTWRDGQSRLTARGAFVRKAAKLTRSAALNAYVDLFRAAIARRPPVGRTVVPLSGGRDSRHILLGLRDAGAHSVRCLSYHHYPPRRNNDVEVAAAACARLGVPHVVLDQRKSRLGAELRKNRLTSFCTDEHAQVLVMADYLRTRAETVYDGIGGDVLSQSSHLNPEHLDLFTRGEFETLARTLLGARGEDVIAAVLTTRAYARFGPELALASVVSELARHAEAPNPVSSFFFWNRTRREIALAPYAILNGADRVYAPYLDYDVFDLLASLPAQLLLGRTFHDEAIARTCPLLADVPYAGRKGMRADRGAVRRFAADAAAYIALGGRSALVRRSHVVPRLLRGALDGDYYRSLDWMAPFRLIHLLQVERFCTEPYRVASGGNARELRQTFEPEPV